MASSTDAPAAPSTAPEAPPGYRYQLVPDGPMLTHVVSFRVTADEMATLLAFRDTFQPAQWSQAFRFLLTEPRVTAVISERVRECLG